MSITINLADRYQRAFGCQPAKPFDPIVVQQTASKNADEDFAIGIGVDRANIGIIKAVVGGNIFANEVSFADLTLKNSETGALYHFKNTILNDNIEGVLAPPPMLKFSRKKNIVTSKVDGSDAQVIESFGLDPYDITISGILIDTTNHHYPSVKVVKLREIFEANVIYDVVGCKLMEDMGIESIYISNISDVEVLADYQDTVKYKLSAHSIKPLEFFI